MLVRSLTVTLGLIAAMAVSGCQSRNATPQDLQGWYSMICDKHGFNMGSDRIDCMNSLQQSNGRQLPNGPTPPGDWPPYAPSQMPNPS
ncbi:hypothetical protein CCGE531_22215 (plasmid) [Rhizobium sp. CCGE531]|nr:hypothetical protein CCGE531_22215 [Rhizobium sp. CCGE531]AYG75957.1 hypothetical protein CCGE532_21690 [Rhizobium sp. CCGE532]